MKINSKGLSIPPYISTSWDNVVSLQYDEASFKLIVLLKGGARVGIPNLTSEELDLVFSSHAEFLEKPQTTTGNNPNIIPGNVFTMGLAPGKLNLDGFGNLTGMMQHDPSQKDAPPLPEEVLKKVADIAKTIGLDITAFGLPEAEPHCNCPFCQITKVMSSKPESTPEQIEEAVSDSDLVFREWDIEQAGDKLYNVSNPFDKMEHYQVYLGQPAGCTCGKNNCEHIIAVLKS